MKRTLSSNAASDAARSPGQSLTGRGANNGARAGWPALAALLLGACGGGGDTGGPVVGPTQVAVSGKATFDLVPSRDVGSGLDYDNIVASPIRGAQVQAVSESGGAILATATTDAAGDFRLTVIANTRMRLRVRAQLVQSGTPSWNVAVVDNTNSGALYAIEGDLFDSGAADLARNINAPSGWDGASYSSPRSAGPFAILDAVYESIQRVLSADADAVFPDLDINWSPQNVPVDGDASMGEIGTTFYRPDNSGSQIFVLGAANNDTDEYDRHVIIHEWGHYFEDAFSRADSVGGPHSAGDRLDPRVSFSEGWGYAFAGMVTGDPVTRDSAGAGQQLGFIIDVERNANANPGWYSEGSLQSILYDLFDADADGVDAVALGFAPLFEVLVNQQRSTPTLTTIFSFITALKTAQPAQAGGIDAIVAAQNIRSVDMDALATTETNDAGNPLDVLPVYAALTVGGPDVNVCSLGGAGSFGSFNKLSNRRFVTVELPATDDYRIVAAGPAGSDPDIGVYQSGFVDIGQGELDGFESLSIRLSAGTAVLEVYEFTNVMPSPTARGRTCFDISIERL